jgi:DNA (cytosine-5)-methyltransferase 1
VKIGSLCSGIGGLDLGLEWAGLGETAWQVEIDPFCRRILGKHWPRAQQHENLLNVGKHNLTPVDLICFGFPCQDLSSAGAQAGLGGARSGLFYQCLRIVEELAPEWVVVENVASGAKLWVDAVLCELGQLGYASLPIPLSASDVGALHGRARIFVVAHLDRERQRVLTGLAEVAGTSAPIGAGTPAHADSERREARLSTGELEAGGERQFEGNDRPGASEFPGWRSPEPDVVRVVHGVSEGLDGARRGALGNAVVPQCAEVIGWIINELRK